MIRYITLIINNFKNLILKLIYKKKYKSSYIENIDFRSNIRIKNEGKIILGKMVIAEKNCCFDAMESGHLEIGSKTYFNQFCMISCKLNIAIGSNCLFGPGVKIFDNNHKFNYKDGVSVSESISKEISIGDNCWIGANCIILSGTKIGDGCVIGAGSVISGNIPSHSIVTSNRELKIKSIKY